MGITIEVTVNSHIAYLQKNSFVYTSRNTLRRGLSQAEGSYCRDLLENNCRGKRDQISGIRLPMQYFRNSRSGVQGHNKIYSLYHNTDCTTEFCWKTGGVGGGGGVGQYSNRYMGQSSLYLKKFCILKYDDCFQYKGD